MMGSLLNRAFIMALGYAYPAYECFKTVEKNKPEIEKLRFWCQYWILVAVLTVFERVGDVIISWLPMYSEAKLAFFIYLWYPKTRGTSYVYDTFLQPYVAKHETEIDRNLLELRTRAGDIVVLYWQKVTTYSCTRFLEIVRYVGSQSQASVSRSLQQQEQVHQPPSTAPARQPPAAAQQTELPNMHQPSSPAKSQVQNKKQEGGPARAAPPARPLSPAGTEATEKDISKTSTIEDHNPATQDTVMEETVTLARARLRKTRVLVSTTSVTTTANSTSGALNH